MPRAFLSLGSTLGDRLALLREALERLARLEAVEIVGASPLYEAEPWESEPGRTRDETRWYLNCVVAVETTLPPRALLERVQAIETALGRTRPSGTPEAQRFAARTLDIDILFYGREVVSVPDDLHIPHLLLAAVEEDIDVRSEEHTSELQSQSNLVCRLLLEKKKKKVNN